MSEFYPEKYLNHLAKFQIYIQIENCKVIFGRKLT